MYLHLARLDIHTNNFAVKVKPPFFYTKGTSILIWQENYWKWPKFDKEILEIFYAFYDFLNKSEGEIQVMKNVLK